jgi:hypothetical protein
MKALTPAPPYSHTINSSPAQYLGSSFFTTQYIEHKTRPKIEAAQLGARVVCNQPLYINALL